MTKNCIYTPRYREEEKEEEQEQEGKTKNNSMGCTERSFAFKLDDCLAL